MIEMVIAISIFMVVAVIGWTSLQDQMPRFRMVRAARGFKSDLMTVRSLAVQTNRETRLLLTGHGGDCDASSPDAGGGSWIMSAGERSSGSTAWDVLPIDADDDGSDDQRGEGMVSLEDGGKWVCLKGWSTLAGPGGDNVDAIVFSPRGWVSNPASDFSAGGYMEFTFVNQDAARRGLQDEVTVMISRAGLVRLVSPFEELPSGSVGTEMSSATP